MIYRLYFYTDPDRLTICAENATDTCLMDAYMIAESVDLAFLKRFCHMVARKIRKEDRITGKEMESLFNIYRSALNGAKIFFDGFAFTKFKEHNDLCICNNCKLKLKKSGDEKQ